VAERKDKAVRIHRIQKPDDPYPDESQWVDMKVIHRGRASGSVGEESQVFGTVPREFQIARVFADTRSASERSAIEEVAQRKWRDL
jgi:hypothetical protein